MKKITIVCIVTSLIISVSVFSREAPSAQERAEFAGYMKEGHRFLKGKQYARSIEAYRKAVKIIPGQAPAWYNMACAHALSGQKEKALEALAQAVEKGFADPDHIKNDKDLDSLRGDPEFEKILKRAEELAPKDEILIPKALEEEKPLPLMVFCHGTGGNAKDGIRQFSSFSKKEKIIVYLPCGSVRMGRRKRDRKPACNWKVRKDGLRIASKVEQLIKEGKADPERVYMTGFSAGGAMAYMLGIKRCNLFSGMVIFGSTIQQNMLNDNDIEKAASCISLWAVHGKQDSVIPLSKGKNAYKRLKGKGTRARWTEFRGGHRLPPDYTGVLKDAFEWIDAKKDQAGL